MMDTHNPYTFNRLVINRTCKLNALKRELKSQRFKHAHVTLRVEHFAGLEALQRIMKDRQWPALWTIHSFSDEQNERLRDHPIAHHVSFLYSRLVLNAEYYHQLHEIYPNLRRLRIHLCSLDVVRLESGCLPDVVLPSSLQDITFSVCTHVDAPPPHVLAFLPQLMQASIKRRSIKTHIFHENFPYDSFNEFKWNSDNYDSPQGLKYKFNSITRLHCDCFSSLWLDVFPNLQHVTTRWCPAICRELGQKIVSLRLMSVLSDIDCLQLIDKLPKHVQTLDMPKQPMDERLLQKAQTKPHLLRFYTARPPGMSRLHRDNHVLNHLLHRRAWIQASLLIAFVRAQPVHAFKDSILNILTLIAPFLPLQHLWTAEKASGYMRTRTFHNQIYAEQKSQAATRKRKNL